MQKLFPSFSANHVCLMPFSSSTSFMRFLGLSMLIRLSLMQRYKMQCDKKIKTTIFWKYNHLYVLNFTILRFSVVHVWYRSVNYAKTLITAKREIWALLYSRFIYTFIKVKSNEGKKGDDCAMWLIGASYFFVWLRLCWTGKDYENSVYFSLLALYIS